MTITDSGLSQDEIAGSLYRAYMGALGASNPVWDECGNRDETLFMCLADIGGPVLESLEGKSFAEAADVLQKQANAKLGLGEHSWDSFDQLHQLALEAVTRHIAFLMDSEDDAKHMGDMERHWADWVQQKLKGST